MPEPVSTHCNFIHYVDLEDPHLHVDEQPCTYRFSMFRADVRAVCYPQEPLLTWFLYRYRFRGWVPSGPQSSSGSRDSSGCSLGVPGRFSVHSSYEYSGTMLISVKSAYSLEFKLPEWKAKCLSFGISLDLKLSLFAYRLCDFWLISMSLSDLLVAQMVKHLPATWETRVQSLGREDPLEKGMATHSSTLA